MNPSRLFRRLFLGAVISAGLRSSGYSASVPVKGAEEYPVFVATVPNPNDYSLFANGGWDGNWYVGYNTCWVKKLPRIPPGDYAHAYIGAKLGRMKLLNEKKSIWNREPVPGTLYMAISSTAAWSRDHSFLLTSTEEIPLEGDVESAVEGTGESQWFWAEIPLQQVNLTGENYLALWSPAPDLINVSSSPILAAAWGGKSQDTWLLRDITGAPPRTPVSVGTPISYFQPAMALKLVPKSAGHAIEPRLIRWIPSGPDQPKPVLIAGVSGESIQQVWVELSPTRLQDPGIAPDWKKVGRALWKAPYIFTLDPARLPKGRAKLRVVASNVWEERTASLPFSIDVSTFSAQQL